ncbi:MAG: DUF1573 domain-containing protein [Cytophagales bacterium]|nr:DUF1573 domain-containing protein [Cytophagales bacterium]
MASTGLWAQTVDFPQTIHDLGNLKEHGGSVEYRFYFFNRSQSYIQVDTVVAACGCTAPDWTRGLIKPGQRGEILVSFTPYNQPGYFEKSIHVFIENDTVLLILKGHVIPEQVPQQRYPFAFGPLRTDRDHLSLGNVASNEIRPFSLLVYNDSSEPIQLGASYVFPPHIRPRSDSAWLPPLTVDTLWFDFDPRQVKRLGYATDKLEWPFSSGQRLEWRIHSTISHPLGLTAVPRLHLEPTELDFGTIGRGQHTELALALSNLGKQPLLVERIQVNCPVCNPHFSGQLFLPGSR